MYSLIFLLCSSRLFINRRHPFSCIPSISSWPPLLVCVCTEFHVCFVSLSGCLVFFSCSHCSLSRLLSKHRACVFLTCLFFSLFLVDFAAVAAVVVQLCLFLECWHESLKACLLFTGLPTWMLFCGLFLGLTVNTLFAQQMQASACSSGEFIYAAENFLFAEKLNFTTYMSAAQPFTLQDV